MVQQCRLCGQMHDVYTGCTLGASGDTTTGGNDEALVGSVVADRYTIAGVIGVGSTGTVHGSAANDTFTFDASGAQKQIVVNGTTYMIGAAKQVTFNGNGGVDTATLIGGNLADKATLRGGRASLISSAYTVNVQAEFVTAKGGIGDIALVHEPTAGSQWGNDASGTWVFGRGTRSSVSGFMVIAKIPKATAYTASSIATADFVGPIEAPKPGQHAAMGSVDYAQLLSLNTGAVDSTESSNATQPMASTECHWVGAHFMANDAFTVQRRGLSAALQDAALLSAAEEGSVSLRSSAAAENDLGILEEVFGHIGRSG